MTTTSRLVILNWAPASLNRLQLLGTQQCNLGQIDVREHAVGVVAEAVLSIDVAKPRFCLFVQVLTELLALNPTVTHTHYMLAVAV